MNLNRILDEVLKTIYDTDLLYKFDINPYAFTMHEVREAYNKPIIDGHIDGQLDGIPLDDIIMQEVLEKLAKDGFLKRTTYELAVDRFSTTFEGRWFIQNGGYETESTSSNAERLRVYTLEQQTLKNSHRLNFLTGLLVVGTLIAAWYYGIEIWKHYHVSCP